MSERELVDLLAKEANKIHKIQSQGGAFVYGYPEETKQPELTVCRNCGSNDVVWDRDTRGWHLRDVPALVEHECHVYSESCQKSSKNYG